MKQIPIDQFVRTVRESKLLTPAQKQELLDQPELWPEEWRVRVMELVTEYEASAKERDELVRARAEAVYLAFEKKVLVQDLDEDIRQKLLAKARLEIVELFPKSPNA